MTPTEMTPTGETQTNAGAPKTEGATMDVPEIRMAERCATCAYRAGTDAANSPLTLHKARACLATGTPFLCHESPIPAMCSGWTDAIMARAATGEGVQEWNRQVHLTILDAIEAAENGDDPDLFKMLAERLRETEER